MFKETRGDSNLSHSTVLLYNLYYLNLNSKHWGLGMDMMLFTQYKVLYSCMEALSPSDDAYSHSYQLQAHNTMLKSFLQ